MMSLSFTTRLPMARLALLLAFFAGSFMAPSLHAQKKTLKSFHLQQAAAITSSAPSSNSISYMSASAGRLWLGTSNGVAVTSNGGLSWTSYYDHPAFVNTGIYSLIASRDTVWASTGYDKEISDGTVQTGS